ncbi:Lrp/AsnC family transcriptional regulator [Pectinatus sottacetonis]|uniref:Lrp/AsnC family transcriptional regulator n=1 Tax=Pectinatus sottacetonis TaxID=1002795 RepID=UPI0018C744EE|nr:Lrp/AsnC family transcriptional regulator [Pectinatus sottacetonis]
MKNNKLDHIDLKIIQMLQKNARISLKEIAKVVFLSSPAVSARIKTLMDAEYITGFYACVNPKSFGYCIKAFINVEVDLTDKKTFYPFIRSQGCVIECNCVTGDYSMLLEVLFSSTDKLDEFIGKLQRFGKTKTLIVFSTVIEHRDVDIQ